MSFFSKLASASVSAAAKALDGATAVTPSVAPPVVPAAAPAASAKPLTDEEIDAQILATGPPGPKNILNLKNRDGDDGLFCRTMTRIRNLGYEWDEETYKEWVAADNRLARAGNIAHEPESEKKQAMDYAAIARDAAAAKSTALPMPTREEIVSAMSSRVIGHAGAIELIAREVRMQLRTVPKPDGGSKPRVLLFPGPTGTGKTELAKSLAGALGVELVRWDMGEYGDTHAINNLIGAPKGYQGAPDGGALPNAIRKANERHGRLVILFDEIEKADKSLPQRLLAFFDEGRAADSLGSVRAPKDTIIVLTTNLCAETIAAEPDRAKDLLRADGAFSAELLGRVSKIIPIARLGAEDSARLVRFLVDRYAANVGITIVDVAHDAMVVLVRASVANQAKAGGRGVDEVLGDLLSDDILDFPEDATHAKIVADVERADRVRVLPVAA